MVVVKCTRSDGTHVRDEMGGVVRVVRRGVRSTLQNLRLPDVSSGVKFPNINLPLLFVNLWRSLIKIASYLVLSRLTLCLLILGVTLKGCIESESPTVQHH